MYHKNVNRSGRSHEHFSANRQRKIWRRALKFVVVENSSSFPGVVKFPNFSCSTYEILCRLATKFAIIFPVNRNSVSPTYALLSEATFYIITPEGSCAVGKSSYLCKSKTFRRHVPLPFPPVCRRFHSITRAKKKFAYAGTINVG